MANERVVVQTSNNRPPPVNSNIWLLKPLLPAAGTANFVGRVFVEVFEQDVQSAIIGGDASLVSRARTVLSGPYTVVPSASVPLTNEPATGPHNGLKFLGRVAVDLWSDRVAVHISGSDPTVLEKAKQQLSSL